MKSSELWHKWFRPRSGRVLGPANLVRVMLAVAVVGVAASFLVARGLLLAEQRLFLVQFEHRARDRAMVIERELSDSVAAVESIAALFAASEHVDREEFRSFASAILEIHPGIRAVGYDPVIRAADRKAHVAALRAEGYADFSITERDEAGRLIPAASRDWHVAVTYLEPLAGNEAALGYDIASEPVRRKALLRARDGGLAAMTAPLRLVQEEAESRGVLIAVPIPRTDASPAADAWAGTDGFAVGVLRISDMVAHALTSLQPAGLHLRLTDVSPGVDGGLLHIHRSRLAKPEQPEQPEGASDAASGPMESFSFSIAGRRWELVATPTPELQAAAISTFPLGVLLLGLVLTGLLVSYLAWHDLASRRLQRALMERNRAEARRVDFGRMLDESHDEIYVFDSRTLKIVHVNRGARENTGYSMDELRNLTPIDLKPQMTPESFAELLRPLREGQRKRIEFTTVHRRKMGTLYDVEVHLQLSTFDGNPVFVAVVLDITERKHLDERMRQSQRIEALGTLAGGIAHDFNNLLTAILGYTQLSQSMARADAGLQANLDEVMRASERARALVKRILAFSRRGPIDQKPIELGELVREALDLVAVSAPAGVVIHKDLQAGCRMMGDPTQIHQVVMNLCTNALHSMRDDKGTLEVELTPVSLSAAEAAPLDDLVAGKYARLTVRDQGSGIEPEVLDRIFDPFFTTKQPGEGSGMGLSVVHGIVRSHGGALRVVSEPGTGTTFEVYLRQTEASFEDEAQRPLAPGGSGESVLVVDDEPSVSGVLMHMLEDSGYTVESFSDSEMALARFRECPDRFDLVITDYNMPGLTGTQLAQLLRRVKPDQPIVMLSGYGDLIDSKEIAQSRVCEFLSKPVRIEELRAVVRSALSGAGDAGVG